jgi:hypothetical protein
MGPNARAPAAPGRRPSDRKMLQVYAATMLAQQVIALQTELHRPKPLSI